MTNTIDVEMLSCTYENGVIMSYLIQEVVKYQISQGKRIYESLCKFETHVSTYFIFSLHTIFLKSQWKYLHF